MASRRAPPHSTPNIFFAYARCLSPICQEWRRRQPLPWRSISVSLDVCVCIHVRVHARPPRLNAVTVKIELAPPQIMCLRAKTLTLRPHMCLRAALKPWHTSDPVHAPLTHFVTRTPEPEGSNITRTASRVFVFCRRGRAGDNLPRRTGRRAAGSTEGRRGWRGAR